MVETHYMVYSIWYMVHGMVQVLMYMFEVYGWHVVWYMV
jgi:hypothetical protein